MNNRKYFIGLTVIIVAACFYFFRHTPTPELTSSPEKKPEGSRLPVPRKVVRAPIKVVPSPKNVPQDIKEIRSKQKLHLSAIYTAQKAMHADYNRYSTDLQYMGYGPDGNIDFKIGFVKPFYPAELAVTEHSYEDPERMTNDRNTDDIELTITEEAHAVDLSDYAHLCKKGCTANEKEFEIMVVSPLKNGKHDVWVINEKKEIVQVLDGTK